MSERGLVSATIPFLNSERFLQEAVESVIAQTYPHWELFLVDDGSVDGGTAIAQSYARRRPDRIHYLEHPGHGNRGMAATRNLGLAYSRGEFIARLDSDDRWDPDHLEVQVRTLRNHPDVAMTFGPMRVWFSWDEKHGAALGDWIQRFEFPTHRVIEPPGLLPCLLSGRNDPQGVVVRRSRMDEVGGYEESIHLYEDMTLYCRIAAMYPTYVVERCTYWYRRHPDSYCRSVRADEWIQQQRQFLEWLEHLLAERGLEDPRVDHALGRAQWRNDHPRLHQLLELPHRLGRAASRLLRPPTDLNI
jgi:glycosyltransferase involved in cell wall biosynthesis